MNLRQDAAKKMDQLRRLIVVYRDGRQFETHPELRGGFGEKLNDQMVHEQKYNVTQQMIEKTIEEIYKNAAKYQSMTREIEEYTGKKAVSSDHLPAFVDQAASKKAQDDFKIDRRDSGSDGSEDIAAGLSKKQFSRRGTKATKVDQNNQQKKGAKQNKYQKASKEKQHSVNNNQKTPQLIRADTSQNATIDNLFYSERSSSDEVDDEDLKNLGFEERFMLLNYFRSLPAQEKSIVTQITNLSNDVNMASRKQIEYLEKVDKLSKKYISTFRQKNPDLRHFRVQQIKDYTDLLVKESQNLRQPNSTILVTGGVLFIFFGTLSLSILIARVFYQDHQIDGKTYDVYLE